MNEGLTHASLQKLKCLQKEENLRANLCTNGPLTSFKNSKGSGFAAKNTLWVPGQRSNRFLLNLLYLATETKQK